MSDKITLKDYDRTINYINTDIIDATIKGANVVETTFGPSGDCVAYEGSSGGFTAPIITKDGVSVVNELYSYNRLENMGFQLLKEASTNILNKVGDGTTSVCILAKNILTNIKSVLQDSTSNIAISSILGNKITTRASIIKELESIKNIISDKTSQLPNVLSGKEITPDLAYAVAYTSSGSSKIANLIKDAIKLNVNSKMIIGTSTTGDSYAESTTGFYWDQGLISPYQVNDVENIQAVADDCKILLIDNAIDATPKMQEFLSNFIKYHKNTKTKLLIIAREFSDPFITLVGELNKTIFNLGLGIFTVQCPGFGIRKTEQLTDMSILLKTELFISLDNVNTSSNFILNMPHSKVTIKQFESIISNIIPGGLDENVFKQKLESLNTDEEKNEYISIFNEMKNEYNSSIEKLKSFIKKHEETSETDFDKSYYRTRWNRLNGNLVELKIGGTTESEVNELKARVDDAIRAVEALIKSGATKGCCCAYSTIADLLDKDTTIDNTSIKLAVVEALNSMIDVLFRNTTADTINLDSLGSVDKNSDNYLTLIKNSPRISARLFDPKAEDIDILDPVLLINEVINTALSLVINVLRIKAVILTKDHE